jgi:hypothetical protein
MPSPKYPLSVDTLGKLIDTRHHLQPHCDDCGEGLCVNMEKLAARIGAISTTSAAAFPCAARYAAATTYQLGSAQRRQPGARPR